MESCHFALGANELKKGLTAHPHCHVWDGWHSVVVFVFVFVFQLADMDIAMVVFLGGLHIGAFPFAAYEVVEMNREGGMRLNTY